MEPDFFKYLPTKITTNIFLRLSVRSIAASKCVCKRWLQLLERDDFVSSHFAQSAPALALTMFTEDSNWLRLLELEEEEEEDVERDLDLGSHDQLTRFNFPYHKATIGGSANGLLFLFDLINRVYLAYICNPVTRELIELRCGGAETIMTCGFGVNKLGQPKVVSIDTISLAASQFRCHVYTLGTGSWRLVELTDSFEWSRTQVGAFVRGNLHWMVSSDPDYKERISCLDLETERFSSLAVPPLRGRHLCRRLYALRDSLGFCEESASGVRVAVWLMKEYGDEKSWRKVCVVGVSPERDRDKFKLLHPIKVYENGDVLLWFEKKFFYHSKKTKSSREIGGLFGAGEEFEYWGITANLHTPSMVSLKKCFGSVENVISF